MVAENGRGRLKVCPRSGGEAKELVKEKRNSRQDIC